MNEDSQTTSSDPTDPLDAMLSQARWPEAQPGAHAWLAGAYREARSVERRRVIPLRTAVALAASVMVVFGVARFARVHHPPAGIGQPVKVVVHERLVPIGRPPTQLETAMIVSKVKREAKAGHANPNPPVRAAEVKKQPENVDVLAIARELGQADLAVDRRQILLVQLLRDASPAAVRVYLDSVARAGTRDVSLAALDGASNPPIDRLIAALRDPLVDRRIAAARALGYIDGPVLTSRLIKMAESDQSRQESMIALACSRGEAAQRYLDRAAVSGSMVGLARSVRIQFDVR